MQKTITHIDLDYFFAQIEERKNPSIVGKPVVVCIYTDEKKGRGAVATANYIARKFGVRAGIPILQAKKLLENKEGVFLPADHALYEQISYGIRSILLQYTNKIEQASIDEFYLDISTLPKEEVEKTAIKIKNDILQKFGLTCSIGIGPNKMVAKIAAGIKKPDGLTVVKLEEVQKFLDELDVEKIPGIGKKTKEYLQTKGINTIRQLRTADFTKLAEEIGKNAAGALREAAHGIDNSPVEEEEQKQISRMITLKNNAQNAEELEEPIKKLCGEIAAELNRLSIMCKTVGIQLIDKNMRVYNRSTTLSFQTKDEKTIEKAANELCRKFFLENNLEVRRIGVRVEKLERMGGQKSLESFNAAV